MARPLIVAEPPATYLARSPIVIDCSVLAAILFDEDARDDAGEQIVGRSLHAPWLLDHEIASVAAKKLKAGVSAEAIDMGLRAYETQALTLHRAPVAGVVFIAQRYALSAYDAAYLSVAATLRVPLVTFDRKLGRAAEQHLRMLE